MASDNRHTINGNPNCVSEYSYERNRNYGNDEYVNVFGLNNRRLRINETTSRTFRSNRTYHQALRRRTTSTTSSSSCEEYTRHHYKPRNKRSNPNKKSPKLYDAFIYRENDNLDRNFGMLTDGDSRQPEEKSGGNVDQNSAVLSASDIKRLEEKFYEFDKYIPAEVLDELLSRFLINLSNDQLNDLLRVSFQIEISHWFYTDNFRERNVTLPSVSLEHFFFYLFMRIPGLTINYDEVQNTYETWQKYKSKVPKCGAIIIDASMSKILLVQCFSSSIWAFPRGKINRKENPIRCAIREVFEETGIDIEDIIYPCEYIERNTNGQYVRLYFAVMNKPISEFTPRTKGEIKKVQWFNVNSIPDSEKLHTYDGQNNFYLVSTYKKYICSWIYEARNTDMLSKATALRKAVFLDEARLKSDITALREWNNDSSYYFDDSTTDDISTPTSSSSSSIDTDGIAIVVDDDNYNEANSPYDRDGAARIRIILNNQIWRTVKYVSSLLLPTTMTNTQTTNTNAITTAATTTTTIEQLAFVICFDRFFSHYDTLNRDRLIDLLPDMIENFIFTCRRQSLPFKNVTDQFTGIAIIRILSDATIERCADYLMTTFNSHVMSSVLNATNDNNRLVDRIRLSYLTCKNELYRNNQLGRDDVISIVDLDDEFKKMMISSLEETDVTSNDGDVLRIQRTIVDDYDIDSDDSNKGAILTIYSIEDGINSSKSPSTASDGDIEKYF